MNKITPTRGLLDLNVSDISATPETTNDEDSLATEYTLDVPRIPSLQLPLNVLPNPRSVKNAIKMCGGIGKIKAAFKEENPIQSQLGLELYLNANIEDSTSDEGEEEEEEEEEDDNTVLSDNEDDRNKHHINGEKVDDETLQLSKGQKRQQGKGKKQKQRGEGMIQRQKNLFFNEHPIRGKRAPYRDDSIILKITMPKGTLAKQNNSIRSALQSLDPKEYTVTPVAIVNNSIKFRELSDFQVRLDNVPAAYEYQTDFRSLDLKKIKKYVDSIPENDVSPQENVADIIIDRSLPSPASDYQLPPPPRFSLVGLPHRYMYKQNSFAVSKDDGTFRVSAYYVRNYQILVDDLDDSVKIPTKPDEALLRDYREAQRTGFYPGSTFGMGYLEALEECVELLNKLFSRRPVWVKRHLDGIVPERIHHTIKVALALVSYRFTMGPWRNTYIKLGCDPRSSNEYAKYQTEYFKIPRKMLDDPKIRKNIPEIPTLSFESNNPGDIDTRFEFDGTRIPWYLMLQIDLLTKEPNIAEVFNKVEYLPTPSPVSGWFTELDLFKMRSIMKYELICLAEGNHNFDKERIDFFKTVDHVSRRQLARNRLRGRGGVPVAAADGEADVNMLAEEEETAEQQKGSSKQEDLGVEPKKDSEESKIGAGVENNVEGNDDDDDQGDVVREDEEELINEDVYGDIRNGTFNDVISRVAELDPKTAEYLRQLDGFVDESNI